jgi:hypothetical protein
LLARALALAIPSYFGGCDTKPAMSKRQAWMNFSLLLKTLLTKPVPYSKTTG